MERVYVLAVALCLMATAAAAANIECSQMSNTSCETCLKNVSCLWCNTNSKCLDYPVRNILPPSSLCKLSDARWGICWVNFEALIIAMSVVGGVIILSVVVCCCCCCRKKKNRNTSLETERSIRESEERKVRQEERRVQMKSRHDEIRKKYGFCAIPAVLLGVLTLAAFQPWMPCWLKFSYCLFKEDNPYTKFDN